MKRLPNIEKLPGKRHYTGYAHGPWTIVKDGRRLWRASRQQLPFAQLVATTLELMADKLAAWELPKL